MNIRMWRRAAVGGAAALALTAWWSAPVWSADATGNTAAPAAAAQTGTPAAPAQSGQPAAPAAGGAAAETESKEITLKPLAQEKLANAPGNTLTAVEVQLPPGASSPAHRHGGYVFAYVISGKVRSQLNDDKPKVYRAGQSWTEPPGTHHSMFENASHKKRARVLAVIVAPDGAEITTYDKAGAK